ncbi:MAG: DUF1385 domain-containing protein [Bariatricus sp.]|nr:DUF1385 domain-containing protein [Bariatricus sp.]
MKSSNIGGQAVLEGVMMKNRDTYAVAVRKPDGEIEIKKDNYKSVAGKWIKLTKIPFIRGVFNFIDSMVLGMSTLNWSAGFYEDEEETRQMTETEQKKSKKMEDILMALTMVVSFALAIGIFMVLPYFISDLLKKWVPSYTVRLILEGVIRIAIFVGYVALISLMKDIKRLYQYHGAEHKCINCIEHGLPLTVENVRKSSKEHKRCGTSFMLFVMIVGIVLLFFVRVDSVFMRVIVRIALLPVIAGISYELIKWAGSSNNPIVCILSKPGLMLQHLTTKEPDDEMIEVGIASVEAVFDWKEYLRENFGWQGEVEKSDVPGSI